MNLNQHTMDLYIEQTTVADWLLPDYASRPYDKITRRPNSTHAADSNGLPFVRILCDVYISLPIAIAGIIGSVLSFIVLCHHRPRLTPTVVLQYLAVADAANLAFGIPLRSLRYLEPKIPGYEELAFPYIFCALYPLTYVVRLFGTWLVVLLTVDRFIAVCHPLHASRLCTVRRTKIQVLVLFLASVVVSLPRFAEYYVDHTNEQFGFSSTWIVQIPEYGVVYRIIIFTVVMYLVPMVTVCILNTLLLVQLKRSLVARSSLHYTTAAGGRGGSSGLPIDHSSIAGHTRLASITAAVVLMSVISDVVAMTTHALWSLKYVYVCLSYLEQYRRYLAHVTNVFTTLNSAMHFVVYCAFGRQFRRVLVQMLKCEERSRGGASQATESMLLTSQHRLSKVSNSYSPASTRGSLQLAYLANMKPRDEKC